MQGVEIDNLKKKLRIPGEKNISRGHMRIGLIM